jgi:hypothetical protein
MKLTVKGNSHRSLPPGTVKPQGILMALFRRRPQTARLPADILMQLERFGRFHYEPQQYPLPSPILEADMYRLAQSDQAGFLADLAAVIAPTGGWAAYGGMKLVMSVIGPELNEPNYNAIVMAGLQFFRSHGVPTSRLSPNELGLWHRLQGDQTPWLAGRPAPPDRLTPLRPGEQRRVAQVAPGPHANVIYVRAAAPSRYVAVIDGEYSETDPQRVQHDWYEAASLHQLYLRVGEAFQTPSYWADPELEPYFPLPPSTL